MNNEKKQIILNWLKQQEETDSLTQEQRDIFALIRESLHTKKYGLVFEEKEEDIVNEANNSILTLKQKDLIIANNNTKELNYLLEGDNYQALKLLQKTHRNRIDVIYIDPPYNTGNKDFIYNDHFVDLDDGFRHSKWLSFMKKRLELAKTLLNENGVIFISIDDRELFQIKLLFDEIFSETNFIACLPRILKKGGKTTGTFSKEHDYVLIYSKSENMNFNKKELSEADALEKSKYFFDDKHPERGYYKLTQCLDYDSLQWSESMDFEIDINGEKFYPGGSFDKYLDRKKGIHKRNDWVWRWSQQLVDFGIKNDLIVIKRTKNGSRLYTKTYLNTKISKNGREYFFEKQQKLMNYSSLEFIENKYSNDYANKELNKIFDAKVFDYPKPLSLIYDLIKIHSMHNSIILDFFAGSGTTGHAVAKLNADDGGNRTYILCTNNENNICENVTFKRLSNIQGELPHSLIYQQIETINKDEFIGSNYDQKYLDQLEESSKQLAQLELGKLIDNKEIFFITSQDELENANEDDLLNATVIFMNENKVDPYRSKVYDHIKNKIIIIPDNYYEKELKETDYLW
ncbi:site-specific DNA-methyltransferase [Mycoplasma sp. VS42A]|uniref:site-specific DNA-methyltransferase n=1 Tax=Mycoplasma sp. VS42A TaxID=3398774 RepID=UPI003A843C6A